ncbi:hypothetical protein MJO28_007045 [Puccinia striiformis f. sp. tritici]|uniref:Uncharacterized protein n=2 Tax=Puccinia striiformis TaxID=27350 RepID=A0A2S4UVT3_9BASI|nr:hypothetical protein MJO28_007045 [Puccinia striiformis f. sp. tritici]POW01399.1 hypothetical protein PSTT_12480 [Puccinia striiformis]
MMGGRDYRRKNEFKEQMRMMRLGHLLKDHAVRCRQASLTSDETVVTRNNNEDPCWASSWNSSLIARIPPGEWICAPIHRFFKLLVPLLFSLSLELEVPFFVLNKNQESLRLSANS